MTLLETSEHCAALRAAYRADLVRVSAFGWVTVEVFRGGGLLASSTALDLRAALQGAFAGAPS